MPGTIRVSVLEVVDLPEAPTDGTIVKDVTAKVTLGPELFKTEPGIADRGRIDSWNSDFYFPVTNLRDKLVVAICDSEDQSVTQTAIEIPSIIEKGSRDEFVELEGGGRIHLRMSFILTDEERKKIETMRLAALKRREERLTRTVVFQSIQPAFETPPVSAVTISEVNVSTTDERKDLEATAKGPLGFGSTTKPLVPKLLFDYARAVGLKSSRSFKRTGRRSNPGAPDNEQEKSTESANEYLEEKWRIESQRAQNMPEAETAAMANALSEQYMLVEGQVDKRNIKRSGTPLAYRERMQRWGGQQGAAGISKLEGQFGQGQRSEARSGPGARWAQKTDLDIRWTSPGKARRIVREEWNGQFPDPFKARAKILELMKSAAGLREAYCDRSFQEQLSLADNIGAVLSKVVSGAAMLLAALFMMWPLGEGSLDGSE